MAIDWSIPKELVEEHELRMRYLSPFYREIEIKSYFKMCEAITNYKNQ